MAKPFALSVKVLLRDDDGRCLLIRRPAASKGNPGTWEFPGGKLDADENLEVGLLRKVDAETNLQISLQRVAGIAESESPTKQIVYLITAGHLEGESCG